VVVSLRVTPAWGSRSVSGALIVAKPGTFVRGIDADGTGSPPFSLPPGATVPPDPELAFTPFTADRAGNALVSLTFTPPARGTYPVIVGGMFTSTTDCSSTAPRSTNPSLFEGEVGTVVVS
jgi:hypothetical protein